MANAERRQAELEKQLQMQESDVARLQAQAAAAQQRAHLAPQPASNARPQPENQLHPDSAEQRANQDQQQAAPQPAAPAAAVDPAETVVRLVIDHVSVPSIEEGTESTAALAAAAAAAAEREQLETRVAVLTAQVASLECQLAEAQQAVGALSGSKNGKDQQQRQECAEQQQLRDEIASLQQQLTHTVAASESAAAASAAAAEQADSNLQAARRDCAEAEAAAEAGLQQATAEASDLRQQLSQSRADAAANGDSAESEAHRGDLTAQVLALQEQLAQLQQQEAPHGRDAEAVDGPDAAKAADGERQASAVSAETERLTARVADLEHQLRKAQQAAAAPQPTLSSGTDGAMAEVAEREAALEEVAALSRRLQAAEEGADRAARDAEQTALESSQLVDRLEAQLAELQVRASACRCCCKFTHTRIVHLQYAHVPHTSDIRCLDFVARTTKRHCTMDAVNAFVVCEYIRGSYNLELSLRIREITGAPHHPVSI